MKIKIWFIFVSVVVVLLAGCSSKSDKILASDNFDERKQEPLGYDFILFDSDGDGEKTDIVKHTVVDMFGGYGQYCFEIYIQSDVAYRKVFDSDIYSTNQDPVTSLIQGAVIDSIYSVESSDVDGDGCDELVCRQYAWVESRTNHIGDVVSVFKRNGDDIEIVSVWLEQ